MFKSLLECTSVNLRCIAQYDKSGLELIPDPDMFIFFKKGTRSGVSYGSNRYSKTNKKYFKSYDPKQESKHIIYSRRKKFIWLCNV